MERMDTKHDRRTAVVLFLVIVAALPGLLTWSPRSDLAAVPTLLGTFVGSSVGSAFGVAVGAAAMGRRGGVVGAAIGAALGWVLSAAVVLAVLKFRF